jgi:diguanylate cyclase (GGDEF)-like protein
VISDQRMPQMTGIELCVRLRERLPDAIRIIVTGFIDVGSVVDAINAAGIHKFIVKPYDRDELLLTVERAIETFEMRRRIALHVQELEAKVSERTAELEAANAALREAHAEVERASLTDPLTGLGNRRFAHRRLSAARGPQSDGTAAPRQAVLMVDIDLFKQVNDSFGHAAGDALLVDFGRLLRRHVGADDVAARWGGEEFLLCVEIEDEAQLLQRADALRLAIAAHEFDLGDSRVTRCSCSIGLACKPLDAQRPDWLDWPQVIDIADHALYLAKRAGRNRVIGLFATANAPTPETRPNAEALLAAGCIEVRTPSAPVSIQSNSAV